MTDLGSTLDLWGAGFAINKSGQVVGAAGIYAINEQACLWDNGVITDLGTLGESRSVAWAINDRGVIVGESAEHGSISRAFLWEKGVMTDLGTLGGDYIYALARAINKDGLVAGWSTTASGQEHACLWIR